MVYRDVRRARCRGGFHMPVLSDGRGNCARYRLLPQQPRPAPMAAPLIRPAALDPAARRAASAGHKMLGKGVTPAERACCTLVATSEPYHKRTNQTQELHWRSPTLAPSPDCQIAPLRCARACDGIARLSHCLTPGSRRWRVAIRSRSGRVGHGMAAAPALPACSNLTCRQRQRDGWRRPPVPPPFERMRGGRQTGEVGGASCRVVRLL